MPTSVDEDVGLDERERVAEMWMEEGSYNLKVSVDDVGAVQVIHGARHLQQLMSRYQDDDRVMR